MNFFFNFLFFLTINFSLSTKVISKESWLLDKNLSSIEFELPVLFANNVQGKFEEINGIIEIDLTNKENNKAVPEYPSYRTKIPWDLKFAYSLTYNNSRGQRDFSNNSLMFSGNIDLTPKWKVGLSSGYDFKGKGFTYTQLRFNRDLNSWRLNFSWVPFSDRASWNFFIGIKSGLLSDIKYEKQSEPNKSY